MRKIVLILFFVGFVSCLLAQQNLFVMSYNVENLFDTQHDSLKNDYEYLPDGNRHWSYTRYKLKLHHIAQVIVNIGQDTNSSLSKDANSSLSNDTNSPLFKGANLPDIVGLCEVENDKCLSDLVKYHLGNQHYKYIHEESPDARGIDVAILYRPTVTMLHYEVLRQHIDTSFSTRDVLYASFSKKEISKAEHMADSTIYHIFVCHLPSMLAGKAEANRRQNIMRSLIQHKTDSLLAADEMAKIIVMGDMNGEPKNNIFGLENLMLKMPKNRGTHKYAGQWEYLDQIYISNGINSASDSNYKTAVFAPDFITERDLQHLDNRPWRTYNGMRYCKGYSDHFPIYLIIDKK